MKYIISHVLLPLAVSRLICQSTLLKKKSILKQTLNGIEIVCINSFLHISKDKIYFILVGRIQCKNSARCVLKIILFLTLEMCGVDYNTSVNLRINF